jgi:hypothetical protein
MADRPIFPVAWSRLKTRFDQRKAPGFKVGTDSWKSTQRKTSFALTQPPTSRLHQLAAQSRAFEFSHWQETLSKVVGHESLTGVIWSHPIGRSYFFQFVLTVPIDFNFDRLI